MLVARTRNPIVNYEDAEGHFIPKISLLKLLAFELMTGLAFRVQAGPVSVTA